MKVGDVMGKKKHGNQSNFMKMNANSNFKKSSSHGKGRAVATHSTKNK